MLGKVNNETTTVTLKLNTREAEAYRDYYFVASNSYGTATHVLTLRQGRLPSPLPHYYYYYYYNNYSQPIHLFTIYTAV